MKNISKLLLVSLFTLSLVFAFTACSDKSGENANNNSNSEVSQENLNNESVNADVTEDGKKILNLAVGAELTTLYPLNMDAQNLTGSRLCYEGLVNYKDGKVEPWLAKSFEMSEDSKTLTFKLREDVLFHDGTKFNAEAVKKIFSFASQNQNFGSILGISKISSIDTPDEYTVVFHYDEPNFGYLDDFSYREVTICESPEVIEEGNFQTMKGVVGTGPYIYSEVKDGEYVKFIKNDNYWGEAPKWDEIYVKFIPESSSRLQALQNGEVDLFYGSPLISWDDYEAGIKMDGVAGEISGMSSRTNSLVLNASEPNLSDVKVREAIEYAIDKQAICNGLAYGNVNPAYKFFPEGNFVSDVNVELERKYDIEKANKMLDDAGWKLDSQSGIREKDGKKFVLKLTYDSGDVSNAPLATAIKSQLAEVGIDVNTEGQDMMTWWKEGSAGNYGIIIWPDEENTCPQHFITSMAGMSPHGPSLQAMPENKTFFDEIAVMQTSKSKDEAKEHIEKVLKYSSENVLIIPVYYYKEPVLYRTDNVKEYKFTDTPLLFEIDNVVPAN